MSENTPGPDEPQERVSERVVARECEWCGAAIEVRPRAQHQRYCSRGCRQRAYEVRTAQRRQENERAAGTAREEGPVREVVERHTMRSVRRGRAPRPVWQPAAAERVEVPVVASPTDPDQIADYLAAATAAVKDGRIPEHEYRKLFRAAGQLVQALHRSHPRGMY